MEVGHGIIITTAIIGLQEEMILGIIIILNGAATPILEIIIILLVGLLKTKVIKLSWVEDAGNLLLKNMTLLFVPTGVKIMAYFGVIKDIWWKLLLLCSAATALSFLATALVVGGVMKLTRKGEKS